MAGRLGRFQERPHVRHRPDVTELLGIDDRTDTRYLSAGDLERHHADYATLAVQGDRSRLPVDLELPQHDAGNPGSLPRPVPQRASHAAATVQRAGERGHL